MTTKEEKLALLDSAEAQCLLPRSESKLNLCPDHLIQDYLEILQKLRPKIENGEFSCFKLNLGCFERGMDLYAESCCGEREWFAGFRRTSPRDLQMILIKVHCAS
jgi:hypothetical protein